ncbi:RagB/SusD family nutrient uptake outer membrane protein [Tamlana crocina]|uniref:RagB/SusD family nutrient uptake outer membrane protein n=1 Tax=Tamlana crocina TaxID=393006 RepID=A0ABX1D7I9_9FLAO|nr:RagB/SusD family nutrient uptake outer membrane protein [Tamlana crocina]NJX14333.1 RagB/SusD family nutrient uptake outer membrane protein [Tamlana crocina]
MKNYKIILGVFLGLMFFFSCEDYLDIAPESVLDEEEVFSTFKNAQGFVEEMYTLVVAYERGSHTFQDFLYGDDTFTSRSFKAGWKIDEGSLNNLGSYSYLYNWQNNSFDSPAININNQFASRRPGVWDGSLRGIRKANIVIDNVENKGLMVNATQDERDVILGQAYFFRAFFHNEIMKFWGRFPHITEVYAGEISIPRPETYKECALAVNEDYKKAIELLPVNWDDEPYGQRTLGENKMRVTKGAAYAFQGKNLLLAASPLMHFNNQPGINTYEYDTELCDMAVDAFAGILKLADQGRYRLATTLEELEEVFWKSPAPRTLPGGTEFIFSATGSNNRDILAFTLAGVPRSVHNALSETVDPTHNFIHNNFGMANGLSTEHPNSGYDPSNPFDNRDPRFYKWHIIDGQVLSPSATGSNKARHEFAQLWYVSQADKGFHRDNTIDTRESALNNKTGYMQAKFYPIINGEFASQWNGPLNTYVGALLHMRLTDVYLMYAEALHASKGATSAPASYPSLTAEGAINKFRDRAGVPHVLPSIVSNRNSFMDELRRERAVELSYEAHRWVDIRRWGVAHLDRYKIKYGLNFPEDHSSFTPVILKERVCEYPKHYWVPFEPSQTQIYEGFPQNPGW